MEDGACCHVAGGEANGSSVVSLVHFALFQSVLELGDWEWDVGHVGVSVRSVPQSQLFVFTRNWFVKQVRPDGWLESQRVAVRRSLGEVRTRAGTIPITKELRVQLFGQF